MLVLSRMRGESIVILNPDNPDDVLGTVEIVDIRGDKVRLGITFPRRVEVHRKEVLEKIKAQGSQRDPLSRYSDKHGPRVAPPVQGKEPDPEAPPASGPVVP